MFSKKPAAPQRPNTTNASKPMPSSTFSVLGADMAITGDISASADLHIDGKVDGDITCAALVQGESSEITGAVTAGTARLSGVIKGSITARELIIMRSARIQGDVHYESLTIEQGAQVQGQFAQQTGKTAMMGEEPRLTLAASSAP